MMVLEIESVRGWNLIRRVLGEGCQHRGESGTQFDQFEVQREQNGPYDDRMGGSSEQDLQLEW